MADVIAIFGPTASGKSAVAEALADRIPARLISADAMQVYRGIPILTNQSDYPTALVGIWDLDHEAASVCREMGLPMVRAAAPNDDAAFLEMMADVVRTTYRRYERGIPLSIVSAPPPPAAEPLRPPV